MAEERHSQVVSFCFVKLYFIDRLKYQACPVHTASSVYIQQCFTGMGFVNTPQSSVDEICRMYEETLYCSKRGLSQQGLDCNLQDISNSLSTFYDILGPKNFSYTQCKLEPEVVSICQSEERLSLYALEACRPYLAQIQFVGDPQAACAYSTVLVQCVTQSLGYLGVTCSNTDIEIAFKSQTAANYLNKHAPGVDLSVCFKVSSVIEDKNCVDFGTVFTSTNATQCLQGLQNVNITDGMDDRDRNMQCSFVQEVQACMVKQIRLVGSNCTMSQMKSVLNTYAHLSDGIGDLNIAQCPENDSYINLSICEDQFRLESFMYEQARTLVDTLSGYNDKDLACTIVKSSAAIFLKSLSAHCTSTQTDSALASLLGNPLFREQHPQLNLGYCFNTGTNTATITTPASALLTGSGVLVTGSDVSGTHSLHDRRKKRNAVAVKEWLWKDKKIPYIIDKSDFSMTQDKH